MSIKCRILQCQINDKRKHTHLQPIFTQKQRIVLSIIDRNRVDVNGGNARASIEIALYRNIYTKSPKESPSPDFE